MMNGHLLSSGSCRLRSKHRLPARDLHSASDSAHVLAIGNDPRALRQMADYLGDHEMRVTALPSGRALADTLASQMIDAVVVDVPLSREDALQIARSLREESDVPIIMLSALADEADRVMALEMGADDYVTKPFSPRELLARIRGAAAPCAQARNRAQRAAEAPRLSFCRLASSMCACAASPPRRASVHLTNHEFNLLAAFLAAPQRVLSRSQLISLSRLHDDEIYDRAIDVQVCASAQEAYRRATASRRSSAPSAARATSSRPRWTSVR